MPIPGFSTVPSPERITGAEAVDMVIDRFKSSHCSDADACTWLDEQLSLDTFKLLWLEDNPESMVGLCLTGEGFIYIPCFPHARATDRLDWHSSELRCRIRYPKIADRICSHAARETGVKESTVRNYVSKTTELRSYIEELPEPSLPQKG
jgi:hypothetical protein